MARLMSDAEWAFFEPFTHSIRGRGGRPAKNHRLVLDGIFWIAQTGAQWRNLPNKFGKWSSVYRQFRRWTLAGLWEMILKVLNDRKAAPDQTLLQPQLIDSIVIQPQHQAEDTKEERKKKILAVQKVASRRNPT